MNFAARKVRLCFVESHHLAESRVRGESRLKVLILPLRLDRVYEGAQSLYFGLDIKTGGAVSS